VCPADGVEDGGDGVGELGVVLPLLSPFRPRRRGGREGSSGALLRLCFSGRPWWRGEKLVVVGGPLLLVVVQVVLFDVCAPAGHGGEGSGVWRWFVAVGGGPGRRRGGWKMGGSGELALWPCAFNASQFRRAAADGSCGRLQGVAVLVSRR
jgi:hypothetical protein